MTIKEEALRFSLIRHILIDIELTLASVVVHVPDSYVSVQYVNNIDKMYNTL